MAREAELARERMRRRTYGGVVNTGLLALFEPGQQVLDMGCGTGAWVPALRAKGAARIVGIEFAPTAAAEAELVYDRLIRQPVEDVELDALEGERFDTIIAADVIEHLVDPWRELDRWSKWVRPGGQLVISVPNIRYFRLLRALVLQGRFDYADEGGVMDRTHLRWFTQRSLAQDLERAGWVPAVWGGVEGRRSRRLERASMGLLRNFLVPQVRVVAQVSPVARHH